MCSGSKCDFTIDEIDGCEFVYCSNIGKMLISFHRDENDCETGLIHCIYPDGSSGTKTQNEAQELLDSGEWKVIHY